MHYTVAMKSTTLQVRLQPVEKEAFEQAAELSGIAVSAWVRERLRSAATSELTTANRNVPFMRPKRKD
jgi:hypothetical protein